MTMDCPLNDFLADLKVSVATKSGSSCKNLVFVEDNARAPKKKFAAVNRKTFRRCVSMPECRWSAGSDEDSESMDDSFSGLPLSPVRSSEAEKKVSRWESLSQMEKMGHSSLPRPTRSRDANPKCYVPRRSDPLAAAGMSKILPASFGELPY
eukprot:Nitzschia sp. Nitz4//scaffold49_size126201//96884//97339//NITZ4_003656-RA/size126201-processed-gene-0.179-mRNA-1//-1//CDS//3329553191//1752//frame0